MDVVPAVPGSRARGRAALILSAVPAAGFDDGAELCDMLHRGAGTAGRFLNHRRPHELLRRSSNGQIIPPATIAAISFGTALLVLDGAIDRCESSARLIERAITRQLD